MATEKSTDEPLPRETGAERSGTDCPTCGEELPAVTTTYGSVVPGACMSCGPDGSDQLEQQRAAADAGSGEDPDEPSDEEPGSEPWGTDVDEETED